MPKIDEIRNNDEKDNKDLISNIPLEDIKVNKQIREYFDSEHIENLARNIEKNGIIHPIILYQNKDDDEYKYTLWIGQNRLMAYKKLYKEENKPSFRTIKAIIKEKPQDKVKTKIFQLSENIQRKELSSDEIRETILYFKIQGGMTNQEIAKTINKTHQYVSEILGAIKAISKLEAAKINKNEIGNSNAVLNEIKDIDIKDIKELIANKNKKTVLRSEVRAKKETQKQLKIEEKSSKMILKKYLKDMVLSLEKEDNYKPQALKFDYKNKIYNRIKPILLEFSRVIKDINE